MLDRIIHRGCKSEIVNERSGSDLVIDPFNVGAQHATGAEAQVPNVRISHDA